MMGGRVWRTPEELRDALQDWGLEAGARWGASVLGEVRGERGVLSVWHRATLRALQGRICRRDRDDLPLPEETKAWDATLSTFAMLPDEQRERLEALLVLVEVAPFVLGPQRVRFTRMDGWAQDVFLERLQTSALPPLRAIFFAFKSLCNLHFWSQPETWGAIGYSLRDNAGVPDRLQHPNTTS